MVWTLVLECDTLCLWRFLVLLRQRVAAVETHRRLVKDSGPLWIDPYGQECGETFSLPLLKLIR